MAWGSLTEIVAMFAPRAFLDSQEVNFPSSTNDFCAQVGYQAFDGPYFPPPWQWSDIKTFGPLDFLSVPPTVPPTFVGGNLSDATAYVHVKAVQGQANLVDIQYWLFYNFNGAETLRVEAPLVSPGEMPLPQSYHFGDWECVTVRVNSSQQVVAVCFSQHSTEQWCLPSEVTFTGANPHTYVSRGSHANRPEPGGPFWIKAIDVNFMTFGPVDYADGAGKVVDYWKSFVIVANDAPQYFPDQPADPGWLKFQGTWGQPLSTPLTPQQVVEGILLAANKSPVMAPFTTVLGTIVGSTTLALEFAGIIDFSKNAPTNPPTKGLWQNALPLEPPLSSKFSPALASFEQSADAIELSLVFVVNDSSNEISTASTTDGVDWTAATEVKQTSRAAPCLVPFNGGLCLAFISNDGDHRILTCLSTDGQTWAGNYHTGQTSPARPALAVFDSKLWVAFISDDSSDRLLVCSSADGKTWSDNEQVTGQTTSTGPALASFNGKLWVAFVANNSSNQLLLCSSLDGKVWGANSLIPQAASPQQPSLAVFNNKLWLAFLDDDNDVWITSSSDGLLWSIKPQPTGLPSQAAPTLAVFDETLYLACIDSSNEVTLYFSPDGATWSEGSVIFPPAV
ncbi:Vps62-related protein [Bradyrhizobium sp. Arg68]|uniref:Vps62-related protein n=1 Tax=Bradyrhizobium ivorense TaxID=2511166 RepID=UPI001E3A4828|nr:Vps62-related protein [Bradyrhizobium ivorense]MCC8935473.1 Vps62-related protein [Bradyrhizobium ivorense]